MEVYLPIKNPSFVRQSMNSLEVYFDKPNSIPELKDLHQERALSRIKSRCSSNSKSPKNSLNFSAGNASNFLNELENQWKNIKEDHRNFVKKGPCAFLEDRSVSPLKIEGNPGTRNQEKIDRKPNNMLTPNKFLKKSVPHSKINLEFCKKMIGKEKQAVNSERNTPEKLAKREFSPCVNSGNNSGKDNQQHFRLILDKYANIYKKNIEIDLMPLGAGGKNPARNATFHKLSSEDERKSLNNSKVSTNTGTSESMIKKPSFLLEKSRMPEKPVVEKPPERNQDKLNERITEKIRKINTTKIYLGDEEASCEIPSENKEKAPLNTQNPQYFNRKQCLGSGNPNSNNRSFGEKSKKPSNLGRISTQIKNTSTFITPKKEAFSHVIAKNPEKARILPEKALEPTIWTSKVPCNRVFHDPVSSSLENKRIIESLYKNCLEPDLSHPKQLSSEPSKPSFLAFSVPNHETFTGFPHYDRPPNLHNDRYFKPNC